MEGVIAWGGFFLLLLHKEVSRWLRVLRVRRQREELHRVIRLRKHVMRERDYGV